MSRVEYRGLVGASRYHSARKQRAALLEDGVPLRAIYEDRRDETDAREAVIASLRPGNVLVVYALECLASNRDDLLANLEAVLERKCSIRLVREDVTLEAASGVAWGRAMITWAGETYNPSRRAARRKGLLGGRPLAEQEMPEDEAREVWQGPGTQAQKIAAMPGWTPATAKRRLGLSKRKKPAKRGKR